LLKGLLVAVLFHGSFDFFFYSAKSGSDALFSTGILSFAFATFYIAVRSHAAVRCIRRAKINRITITSPKMMDETISITGDLDDINAIGFLAQQIWPETYGRY